MRIAWTILLAGLVGGCATATRVPVAERPEEHPTIVRIVSRERVVEVKASGRGALYTARDRGGRVVFADLTREQVKGADPKLWDQMEHQYVADMEMPRHGWAGE